MSKVTIVTHSGNFHTDEVFAVATLLLVYPDVRVVRSREQNERDKADIAVDVGGIYDPSKMRFDHHQPGGAGVRVNGIPYASFGLVWKEFGEKLAGKEEKEIIDTRLTSAIDAIDNGVVIADYVFEGVREYAMGDFFHSFVDNSKISEEHLLEVFTKCVDISKGVLEREIVKAKNIVIGLQKVRKIVAETEDKRIIILDEDLPWGEVLAEVPESLYVVYPRKEGSWGAKAVRKNINSFETRKPFPKVWGGKAGDELVQLTGVSDAVFSHKELYLVGARSKNGAIALAKKSLNP